MRNGRGKCIVVMRSQDEWATREGGVECLGRGNAGKSPGLDMSITQLFLAVA